MIRIFLLKLLQVAEKINFIGIHFTQQLYKGLLDQIAYSGIMNSDGHNQYTIFVFQVTKIERACIKGRFQPYKLVVDVAYPMRPWMYYPFKGGKTTLSEKEGNQNFIQSSIRVATTLVCTTLYTNFNSFHGYCFVVYCNFYFYYFYVIF